MDSAFLLCYLRGLSVNSKHRNVTAHRAETSMKQRAERHRCVAAVTTIWTCFLISFRLSFPYCLRLLLLLSSYSSFFLSFSPAFFLSFFLFYSVHCLLITSFFLPSYFLLPFLSFLCLFSLPSDRHVMT